MNPKISDHESLLNICKHYSISIYNQLECMLRNKAWSFTPLFYTTKPTNWNFAFDFFPEDNEEVIQSDTKFLYIRTGNLNIEIHSNFIYEEFFNTKLISEIDSQTMELRNKTKSKEKLQDLVYTENLFTEIAEHDLDVENYYFTIETKNKRVEIPRIGTKQKLINEQNQRIHSSQPIIPIEIVPEIPISNIPEVVGKSHNLQEIEIKNENTPLKIKLNKIEIFTLVSEEFSKSNLKEFYGFLETKISKTKSQKSLLELKKNELSRFLHSDNIFEKYVYFLFMFVKKFIFLTSHEIKLNLSNLSGYTFSSAYYTGDAFHQIKKFLNRGCNYIYPLSGIIKKYDHYVQNVQKGTQNKIRIKTRRGILISEIFKKIVNCQLSKKNGRCPRKLINIKKWVFI
ncbi:hypothetical protein M0813_22952 [Anaeramoeba flamelloides]|uniref:Uncharacterized protein n=1 Tax=Anaeramoeba flamelloides TaxID=1746091 RepID=A0ABQ8YC69_9EUKA|nr:hypothetical protein M0813_22952 [Anaeramoeba flamelloides]